MCLEQSPLNLFLFSSKIYEWNVENLRIFNNCFIFRFGSWTVKKNVALRSRFEDKIAFWIINCIKGGCLRDVLKRNIGQGIVNISTEFFRAILWRHSLFVLFQIKRCIKESTGFKKGLLLKFKKSWISNCIIILLSRLQLIFMKTKGCKINFCQHMEN